MWILKFSANQNIKLHLRQSSRAERVTFGDVNILYGHIKATRTRRQYSIEELWRQFGPYIIGLEQILKINLFASAILSDYNVFFRNGLVYIINSEKFFFNDIFRSTN